MEPSPYLEVRRLGQTRYEDAYALQQELLEARVRGEIGDVLILTEHEPVVTLGRGSSAEEAAEVRALGIPVFEIERGGEATWHGPGQMVAYPIFALPEGRRDLHQYLRDLEEVVLGVLEEVEIVGRREPGLTGVWIGASKVCSIGVAVRRWVTWHGLALNVGTEPDAFRGFRPCGLAPETMTRVADHAEVPPANLLFEVLTVKHFCRVFGLELPPLPPPTPSTGSSGFPELPILPS
jgi:lipoyl(octanoyl) transferase